VGFGAVTSEAVIAARLIEWLPKGAAAIEPRPVTSSDGETALITAGRSTAKPGRF